MRLVYFFLLLILVFTSGACAEDKTVIRAAHLPNITHAQALVGRANGAFEKKLAGQATIEWKTFNAGPSIIEAVFAGNIDIATVGPSPAVNGYVKSQGEALRVVAGAASGGAALVVRQDAGIAAIGDFHGKKIASPQMGNTQDVALRAWLARNGLVLKDVGGDVQVIPISNADQQTLFLKKEIDAAWTVEPWVSLLVNKAEGKIFLDESSLWPDGRYATTVLIASKKFIDKKPDLLRKFVEAHREVTDWIRENPAQAKRLIQEELARETTKTLPENILDEAFKRIEFTTNLMEGSIQQQAEAAFRAGFLKKKPDLEGLFDKRWAE